MTKSKKQSLVQKIFSALALSFVPLLQLTNAKSNPTLKSKIKINDANIKAIAEKPIIEALQQYQLEQPDCANLLAQSEQFSIALENNLRTPGNYDLSLKKLNTRIDNVLSQQENAEVIKHELDHACIHHAQEKLTDIHNDRFSEAFAFLPPKAKQDAFMKTKIYPVPFYPVTDEVRDQYEASIKRGEKSIKNFTKLYRKEKTGQYLSPAQQKMLRQGKEVIGTLKDTLEINIFNPGFQRNNQAVMSKCINGQLKTGQKITLKLGKENMKVKVGNVKNMVLTVKIPNMAENFNKLYNYKVKTPVTNNYGYAERLWETSAFQTGFLTPSA